MHRRYVLALIVTMTVLTTCQNASADVDAPKFSNQSTSPPEGSRPAARDGILHVLTVGVSLWHPRRPAHDVIGLGNAIRRAGEDVFEQTGATTLLDAEANKQAIEDEFHKLSELLNSQDVFVLFLSGPSVISEGRIYFLLTKAHLETDLSARDTISDRDLQKWLALIPAKQVIIVDDTDESAGLVTVPSSDRMNLLSKNLKLGSQVKMFHLHSR